MLIRVAGRDDLDDLVRLRCGWQQADSTEEFAGAFRDWFRREESTRWWWLAAEGGMGVGMVNVKLFSRMPSPLVPASRWGYLANLFVMPDARGNGIGSGLVRAAVARARAETLARLVLSPSEPSRPLYGRLGFRTADELLVHPLDG